MMDPGLITSNYSLNETWSLAVILRLKKPNTVPARLIIMSSIRIHGIHQLRIYAYSTQRAQFSKQKCRRSLVTVDVNKFHQCSCDCLLPLDRVFHECFRKCQCCCSVNHLRGLSANIVFPPKKSRYQFHTSWMVIQLPLICTISLRNSFAIFSSTIRT